MHREVLVHMVAVVVSTDFTVRGIECMVVTRINFVESMYKHTLSVIFPFWESCW